MVSFSGGRDSSAVLATAVDAARREGLPLPVPVTIRFPDAPLTEEARWQERVIAHLGLEQWVKVDVGGGEMDLVGPLAIRIFERHGLVFPANMAFVEATLKAAHGTCLLTGMGGDDLFVEWRWRELADALDGRRRINHWDLLDAGYLFMPRRVRAALDRRYLKPPPPGWLRPLALERARTALSGERFGEPLRWAPWLRWCAGRVHLRAVKAAFELLADDAGTRVAHPLLDPEFIAALGAAGGATGLGDRATIMVDVFGDVLPEDVCRRPAKATFGEVYWTDHSRAFAAQWDGGGVDPELVDPAALRREWSKPEPDTRSWLLLQSAWLAQHEVLPVATPA
jgi:Asparagine synthase